VADTIFAPPIALASICSACCRYITIKYLNLFIMKRTFILLLILFPLFCFGQNEDSLQVVAKVDSLLKISSDYLNRQDFAKAMEFSKKAEKFVSDQSWKETAVFANLKHIRGGIWFYQGKFKESEISWLEAKNVRAKVLGKMNADYAESLNSLGILNATIGRFEEAELYWLESISIKEKVLGKSHPGYARSLHNLAILYRVMGDYEKAEKFQLEGKSIVEKVLSKSHPSYASSLHSLGDLYLDLGDYEKAELYYLESKSITEKVLSKSHPSYASSLRSLGNLYLDLGNYEKAELYYLESKSITEKVVGKSHLTYALNLNSLGVLYRKLGDYEKAESYYLEAKTIREKVLGKRHPDYASSLNNLGVLYRTLGDFNRAEECYLECKSIRDEVQGKLHPHYAGALHNLGALYQDLGDYGKAESYYLESKTIREKVLGKRHPDYSSSLINLGIIYESQNSFHESDSLLVEYFKLTKSQLSNSVAFLSEKQLADYVVTFKEQGENLASYIFNRQKNEENEGVLGDLNYDRALFQKGFLLNATGKIQSLTGTSPEAKELREHLKKYRLLLALQYAKPIADRQGVEDLESKAEDVEKQLSRTVSGYAEVVRQVNWQEVQSNLAENEVAIEIIDFKHNFPEKTDSIIYAALVIKPGFSSPEFIPLFEEKRLKDILRKSAASSSSSIVAQAYSRGVIVGKKQKREGLYSLILKPLENHLREIETIYVSPSGILHRINFDAIPLPNEKGKTLADKYKLVRLGSTRSLVVSGSNKTDLSNEVVLFGGIDYNLDTTLIKKDTVAQAIVPSEPGKLSFSYIDRTIPSRGEDWNYLPGAAAEVVAIEELVAKSKLKGKKYSKDSASEEAFKKLGEENYSPRVIHFATHGFFFPESKTYHHSTGSGNDSEPVFKMSNHPMIRSGLVMAGGNYAWKRGKPFKEGMEDGILTAYEINQINLSNTELVVLSACDTGLGDIEGDEGVYGLQRAFKNAGAKYLIMSLWQVPDLETKEFMVTFYRHWLEDKISIPDVFSQTQQEMKKMFDNPYQWAGFVLIE
jgi:CHAT domain-containing protein